MHLQRGRGLTEYFVINMKRATGADGRGAKGPSPQTMGKKIKLSCRVTRIDALAVAMAE